jgi:hypothetical protein
MISLSVPVITSASHRDGYDNLDLLFPLADFSILILKTCSAIA